jgi:predicted dehydrogenase
MSDQQSERRIPRRDFLRKSAGITTAALAAGVFGGNAAHSQAVPTLRAGLIGCGGRGTGAARDCVKAAPGVEIHALGDLFPERVGSCRTNLQQALGDALKVTDDRCFTGFDAYLGVINSGVDLVLLAEPPAFRPKHFKAAIEAGKHVFFEKPVAVCPAGVRSIIESGEVAKQKNLAVVAGTLYRHHRGYQETIQRIHDGAIGTILAAQAYYITGELWMHPRQPDWTDLEWQLRNWLYFTWLSGDHIAEQHIHNLDVMNWVMQGHPVRALSLGGRQKRTDPAFGNVYDHFVTEFEYPGGILMMSMCRQMDNCYNKNTNNVIGTEGFSDPSRSIAGKVTYVAPATTLADAYVQEHTDLIASIRKGEPLNEARQVAESTLTAIIGRMSAYTGKEVTWDFAINESKLDLMRDITAFGPMPVDEIAIPGKTPLI